jgi:hypothetical protein
MVILWLARASQLAFEFPLDDGGKLPRCAGLKLLDDFGFDPDLDLAAATWFAASSFSPAASAGSFLFRLFHREALSALPLCWCQSVI